MSSRGTPKTQAVREKLRSEANARQEAYDQLSIQEKLNRLPPEPHAQKQRAKLLAQLQGKAKKIVPPEQIEAQDEEIKSLKSKERKSKEKRQ